MLEVYFRGIFILNYTLGWNYRSFFKIQLDFVAIVHGSPRIIYC
jgi:hypothetical protein